MDVHLEKLKAEIEDDLRSIEEFFETALQSYELAKPSSISSDGYSVTTDPVQENKRHFLEDYMLVFPTLLWRTWKKLEKNLKVVDSRRFSKCFEYVKPKFDWGNNSKKSYIFSYLRFVFWRVIFRPNQDWHYIGPKKFEIEEIREIRNYFVHNHSKASSGLVRKYSYPNTEIQLSREKVNSFISVCKNAKNDIFDPLF